MRRRAWRTFCRAFAASLAVAFPLRAEAPPPLTLSDAVRRGVAASPLVAAAQQRIEAAAGAERQAGRLPNPTADVRVESWDFHADHATPRGDNIDFFATLTQTLELGGRRSARRAEAAAGRETAASEARQVRYEVTLETVRAYLASHRAASLAETLERSRDELAGIVTILGRRVAEGWTAEADLLRFRAELARADEALLRVRLERDRELRLLGALLGEPVPVARERLAPPPVPDLPEGDPEALAAAALGRRPDVAAARSRVARARETARLERARRVPLLDLTLGYERSFGLDTGTAGLAFPLPLFDVNAGNVVRADAEARAAEAELRALESRLLAAGAAQIVAARELRARALAVETDLVLPAEGARDAADAAFREGASDVLRLVDARRLYVEARREALDLTAEAVLRTAEARLLLGEEAIP